MMKRETPKRQPWKKPEVRTEAAPTGISFSCSTPQTDGCGAGKEFCADVNDCINCGETCEPI